MPATELDQIVNLCKRRGFVYPSAEIYGGFRSAYDYGPLGAAVEFTPTKQPRDVPSLA